MFGYRSAGDLRHSYASEGSLGTVRYAGGATRCRDRPRRAAARDRRHQPRGEPGYPRRHGKLHLAPGSIPAEPPRSSPAEACITRSGCRPTASWELIQARRFGRTSTGPGTRISRGALHDPRAGLLASFGATHDDRPSREDVVASADHMLGRSYRSGAVDPTALGWSHYRCGTASACETRHAGSDGWTDWTTTTRSEVLASTAGWTWRSAERPHADRDVARIARHSLESTDGLQGSHVVDGYTGTLEHVAFGTGFERYTDWSPFSNRAFPDTDNFFNKWAGCPGDGVGSPPRRIGEMVRLDAGIPGRTCCRRDPVRGGPREHPILPIRQ